MVEDFDVETSANTAIGTAINISIGDENPTLPGISGDDIVVIRSKKRRRNISAYRQGGKIIISIPARLTKAEEREIVPEMIALFFHPKYEIHINLYPHMACN